GFAGRPRGHTCECGFAPSPSKADGGLGRQRQINAAVGCFCEGWLSKCTAPIFVAAHIERKFLGNPAERVVGSPLSIIALANANAKTEHAFSAESNLLESIVPH